MKLIDDILDYMSDREAFSPSGLARAVNKTFPGPRRFLARQLLDYANGKRPDFPQERAEQLAYVLSRYGYKPPQGVKYIDSILEKIDVSVDVHEYAHSR